MKPYYEEDGITIFHGDCREVLPSLKSNIVLTDPPYGMNSNPDLQRFSGGVTRRGGGWRKHDRTFGDKEPFDAEHLLSFRKVIIWGANHFWNTLPRGGCLVWVKRRPLAFGTFLSDAEIAFESDIRGVYCFERIFAGSQKAMDAGFDAHAQSAHPNQKPVELMSWCLNRCGDGCVLDPYMGSGTTLVAAKLAGRRAIGIEIVEKYCEIAAKRLSQKVFSFEDQHSTVSGRVSPAQQNTLAAAMEEMPQEVDGPRE